MQCHDCHEFATDSSRTAHVEFTTCSRVVHEQFRSSSQLMRNSGARVGAWVYTGLPGHCSPFQRSPARRQLISQRQHAATRKQTKWHDLPRQNRGQKSCKCQPCIRLEIYSYSLTHSIRDTDLSVPTLCIRDTDSSVCTHVAVENMHRTSLNCVFHRVIS